MRYSVSGVSFAPNQHRLETKETKETEFSKVELDFIIEKTDIETS
jgi:hypothetical protein